MRRKLARMQIAFHHIDIRLRHLAPLLALLDDFGFQNITHDANEAWVRTPNAYLHLTQSATVAPPTDDFTGAGISHLCIQTPNMRHALSILARHNARPLSEPVNLGTGHWYVYARTPGGDIIEIEGVPYAPTEATPWLAHVAIVSGDVVRLADFYQQLTGTSRRGGQAIGPNPRFDVVLQRHEARMIPIWLVGLNVTMEFWQFLHPATAPTTAPANYGYHTIGLTVNDVPIWCAQAIKAGATCYSQSATHALLSDPDGNMLQVTQTDAALPSLHACPDLAIIARINALWRPFDASVSWESTI